jgi:hypothetical protein
MFSIMSFQADGQPVLDVRREDFPSGQQTVYAVAVLGPSSRLLGRSTVATVAEPDWTAIMQENNLRAPSPWHEAPPGFYEK